MHPKLIFASILCLFVGLSASAQTEEVENTSRRVTLQPSVLAFAPIQFTENGVAGMGISFERALDKDNIVALYVPAMAVLRSTSRTDNEGNVHTDPMFYVMPGLKIYPTGGYGLAKYAIGPSIVVAEGRRTDNNVYSYPNVYENVTYNHFLLGMMVNNSLNINPTPHLYIGSEFGFGFTYFNRENGINTNTKPLVQFNFKVGYRF